MFLNLLSVAFAACMSVTNAPSVHASDDEAKPAHASVEIRFTVLGMSCDRCAKTSTQLLTEVAGVHSAQVDHETELASVTMNADVEMEALRDALASLGFEAIFEGETAEPPLTADQKANLDIRVVSRGERVDFTEALPDNKITIVDYYAEWCGPCRILSPKLERLLLRYEGLALRKIDMRDWKSDAPKQATHEFRLAGLPYVRVYDARGEFVGDVVGNHIDRVESLVRKAVEQ